MWWAIWLVLLGGGGERVAVMVHDPAGRADALADSVVRRLRAEGVDAMAVAPPRDFSSLAEQDALARDVGAARVIALDVRSAESRQILNGPPGPYRPPELRVWELSVQPMMGPNDPWDAGRIATVGPYGYATDAEALLDPPLNPAAPPAEAAHADRIREQVRVASHVSSRRVGATQADVERNIGTGGMTGWRRDLEGSERQAFDHLSRMWAVVHRDLAEQTAELVLR